MYDEKLATVMFSLDSIKVVNLTGFCDSNAHSPFVIKSESNIFNSAQIFLNRVCTLQTEVNSFQAHGSQITALAQINSPSTWVELKSRWRSDDKLSEFCPSILYFSVPSVELMLFKFYRNVQK